MTDIVNLAERRWDSVSDPADHNPADALRAVLARIERGEIKARHIIVAVAFELEDPKAAQCEFYQSGDADFYAQLGMLEYVKFQMMGAI